MEQKKPINNWEERVKLFSSVPHANKWKILSYGVSKTGKTRFASGMPGDLFILDTDGSLTGLIDPNVLTLRIPREDVLDRKVKVYETVDEILRKLRSKEAPFEKINTFVIDGLTTLADVLMIELMNDGTVGGKMRDPLKDKPTFEEYGVLGNMLETITSKIDDLSCNTYATAGAKVEQDQVTGGIFAMPDIVGSFRQRVMHRFDAVLYFESEKATFYANCLTHSKFPAGIRRWKGPARVENPTFTKIFNNKEYFE